MTIVPTEQAQQVADILLDARDVQRTVLDETLAAAEQGDIQESGRTLCPHDNEFEHGPLARYDAAVDLSSCARGATGIMHSHVTRDQLHSPTHSLPDMANVVFGPADASFVVGVDSGDLMLAPADDRAAEAEFLAALGVDATSPREVVQALDSGGIDNPAAARNAVRSRLSHLFRQPRTGFNDLRPRVEAAPTTVGNMTASACVSMVWKAHEPQHAATRLRRRCQRSADSSVGVLSEATGGINLQQMVVATIIGDMIGSGVDRVLWSRL